MPPKEKEMEGLPAILLSDQSGRNHDLDLTALRQLGTQALPIIATQQTPCSSLPLLSEIEITLVDDPTIARVHADFMNLDEPTDVITFHHGEILISIDTARHQALDYKRTLYEEVALYIVHGLLHLAGYKDKNEADFELMAQTQERILSACLKDKT